jgi:hypothetical protein
VPTERTSDTKPEAKPRWNTDARYPALSNADYGLVMDIINWFVRRWRRFRGVAEKNGLPVDGYHPGSGSASE